MYSAEACVNDVPFFIFSHFGLAFGDTLTHLVLCKIWAVPLSRPIHTYRHYAHARTHIRTNFHADIFVIR